MMMQVNAMRELTVPRLLQARVEAAPEKPFLHFEKRTWTYAAFGAEVSRTAAGLHELGVRPGDRVALFLPNGPEFLFVWFALAFLRATAVPINTAFRPSEAAYPLAHAEPSLVVAAEGLRETLEPAMNAAGLARPVAWAGSRGLDLVASGGTPPDPTAARPEDVSCFIYTSGTTGRPKAAMQTQRNYVLTGEGFIHWLGLGSHDRLMALLPLFHINAQAYSTMGALAAGASLILQERFSLSRFWEQARRSRATEVNILGSMLLMLWRQPPADMDRRHEVRVLYCAPAPREICRQFEERFRVAVVEGFGMSECTFGLIQALHGPRKPGGMGRPRELPARGIRNQIRIVDAEGRDCPPGAPGELLLRNDVMMAGYYKDPQRTAEALRDGWLWTGDLAVRDAEGEYFFMGRKKEMIRRRGENVSPAEVEAVLHDHPAVQEAAVFGVPSEFSEEDVVACVVLREAGGATADDLRAWCAARLAPFKVPTAIHFLDALPKTTTQKVRKEALREAYASPRQGAPSPRCVP
jgi:crotonobetaine/carnitine-CoA ligase